MWHCLLSCRPECFCLCTLSFSGLNSPWSFTPAHRMELTQKTPYCDPKLFNKDQHKAHRDLHGAYWPATAQFGHSEKSTVRRNSDLYPANWLYKVPNTDPCTDGVRVRLACASRLWDAYDTWYRGKLRALLVRQFDNAGGDPRFVARWKSWDPLKDRALGTLYFLP